MVVSCKRTRNLFDLTNLWKNIVLSNMDQQILEDNHDPSNQNINEDIDMDIDNDESSGSTHEDEDPFISLLHNQGVFF